MVVGWQIRRSKYFGPFRVSLTKRGLSGSVGIPGFRMSTNTRGQVRRTVRIPGTGIYNTKILNPKSSSSAARKSKAPKRAPATATQAHPEQPPPPSAPASWYPDPQGVATWRWWDGQVWTQHTA
ncbi:MAG: DUF4236 domain-containing protein [Actinobacteria bacterium]|nr:DUF4236 domain-containing protein [Actinomycetota bacterium]